MRRARILPGLLSARVETRQQSQVDEGDGAPMTRTAKQSGGLKLPRFAWAMLALGLTTGMIPWRTDCRATSDADRAEAVYLKKILSFVEWPSGPGIPDTPFRVCVAADYQIAVPLSEELRGINVNGRTVDVETVRKEEGLKNCQLLFIGSPEPRLRARLLESVKGAQMLTVGDDPGFVEAGGILEFTLVGNTMQFAVNLTAAKRAGLKIGARLLSLAQRVLTEKGTTGT